MKGSSISVEVLRYKKSPVTPNDIEKLQGKRWISFTESEEDVILEVYEEGETICSFHPQGDEDEFFYFYIGPLYDFKIQFPFCDLIADLLTTLNIALTQLNPNGWGFI